jgi:hypothetical protein
MTQYTTDLNCRMHVSTTGAQLRLFSRANACINWPLEALPQQQALNAMPEAARPGHWKVVSDYQRQVKLNPQDATKQAIRPFPVDATSIQWQQHRGRRKKCRLQQRYSSTATATCQAVATAGPVTSTAVNVRLIGVHPMSLESYMRTSHRHKQDYAPWKQERMQQLCVYCNFMCRAADDWALTRCSARARLCTGCSLAC